MLKNKSFLIINPFGIGDVLFSTPIIRNIKENISGSKVFYLCNRRSYPVLANNTLVDKCFIYERDEFEAIRKRSKYAWLKHYFKFISEIKKEKIDTAIDLSLNSQFGFLAWASGIKTRIGYNYKNRGWLLTKKIAFLGYKDKHVVEHYLDFLRFIGIEPKYKQLELFLESRQKPERNSSKPIVVIAPAGGASWGGQAEYKHWNFEKFAHLADKIITELKAKVILAGSRPENEIIEKIEQLMNNRPLKAIGLRLEDFFNLLAQSQLAVVNDGGVLHMAVALGVKTVSIFGPVSEAVYGPYPADKNKHIVIKKDLACRPCYQNFRLSECNYGRSCLETIEADEVFLAVKNLFNKPES